MPKMTLEIHVGSQLFSQGRDIWDGWQVGLQCNVNINFTQSNVG